MIKRNGIKKTGILLTAVILLSIAFFCTAVFAAGESTFSVVYVGSARHDEKGGIVGGEPGDQTGGEVATQPWYEHSKGWIVIRAKSARVREMIARDMELICANPYVGYSQSDRDSLRYASANVNYDAGLVTKPCNADCSSALQVCLLYAGIRVEVEEFDTSTARAALEQTGLFRFLLTDKYTKSPDYLMRGDILLTQTKGHVAVVLNNGIRAGYASETGPVIKSQPRSVSVKEGEQVKFSVTAEGDGLEYVWYTRAGSRGNWYPVTAARGKNSFSFTALYTRNGYQYCCVITDAEGRRVASNTAKLTVDEGLKIKAQPGSIAVRVGDEATFTVGAHGASAYQWYYKKPGEANWVRVAAASGRTPSYTLVAKARHQGFRYRCEVSDGEKTVVSEEAVLTVVTAKPKITVQPVSASVKEDRVVIFSVEASGRALSYQWYYRIGSEGDWKKVSASSGVTSALKLSAIQRRNGYQYKCVVTNLLGSATSKTVKLTVKQAEN